ncbi:carbohydrate sulfotransferase 15-like isoform X2 [Argopecten irradians]|uniref:carbohydrate sulfotransferase 15-like isoform X2 n=1 Tax=Argopecten irradians TaxID=31199 RepID=UPI00371EC320
MADRLSAVLAKIVQKRKLFLFVVSVVYIATAVLVYFVINDKNYDVTPRAVRHLGILLRSAIQKDLNKLRHDPDNASVVSPSVDRVGTKRDEGYSCEVKTEHEDLLCDVTPPKFLPDFKNPCWRESGHPLQCLPYFQLIGVDKSGTTDLFYRLVRHPHVLSNRGYIGKETFWWAWKRYGDGSPIDFWDFRGWKDIPQNAGLRDPRVLTPHLINHVNPNTKFILLLRNPIDRLYSDYFFLPIKRICSPESFHEAVSRSFGILSSCLHSNTLRHCLFDKDLHQHFNENARLNIGFYIVYLLEWLKVFPRRQFLILRFEDYINDIPKYVNRVYRFLGLAPVSLQQTAVLGIFSPIHENVTKKKVKARPMMNRTREILKDIYQPFNVELSNILKNEDFLWS